jgi:hypothetical protein
MRQVVRYAILALIAVAFSVTASAQYSQPVRDVENPARTPFWGYASGTIDLNWVNTYLNAGSVPSGQRLAIELVTLYCSTDADDTIAKAAIVVYKATPGGYSAWEVPILVHRQGSTYTGRATWTASQPVTLYSDGVAGGGVNVNIHHSKTTATASCVTFVSGHTINL